MIYKDGFIEGLVSWDIQRSEYGDWKNSNLPHAIQQQLKKILETPQVKEAFDLTYDEFQKRKNEKTQSEKDIDKLNKALTDLNKHLKEKGFDIEKYEKEREEEQKNNIVIIYSKESIINKIDRNSDISYIKAAYEICNHVLKYKDTYYSQKGEWKKQNKELVDFCGKFLESNKHLN